MALRVVLARPQRDLPPEFPKGDLDAVAGTLELVPQMSAEGAIHALTYARPKLSRIRRHSVRIEDSDALPDVPRGGAIDQAITRLIADVDTAREWYDDRAQEAADQSPFPEAATTTGSPELGALAQRATNVADRTAAIAAELAAGATPGSVPADNLNRRVRDIEVLTRQEGIELAASRPRPRLIDRLNRAIVNSLPWVQTALRAVQVGADFSKVAIERFNNAMTRWGTVICEEISGFARDSDRLLERYQRELAGHQPPAFVVLPPPGTVFRDVDAPWCPEMVVVPAGTFLMGSPDNEEGRSDDEGPQHRVTIAKPFAIGRFAITFAEYDHFCDATGYDKHGDRGGGRARRPVIKVSWEDAQAYVAWLSRETGKPYRLPSEAEWEYACRAGTTTPFSFGETITPEQVNYDGNHPYAGGKKGLYRGDTVPVASLPANPWGLYEMHGNVLEWCEDHWHDSYDGAPPDGRAWLDTDAVAGALRVWRGGSCFDHARHVRSACRYVTMGGPSARPEVRVVLFGFRIARVLEP
ncbi:MAG: formylglycine-generating enzyme family protein [Rhodospirillales bacterium]|nr:MAG: formylglycine-generating enzyme family protein [Rhodospirillales bacterium]